MTPPKTRALRSLGIPLTVLLLAACGTNEGGGAGGATSPEPSPTNATSSTSSAPPVTPTASASPTPAPSSGKATPSTGLPTPSAPAPSPTSGQGPHGPDASRASFPMKVIRTGGIAGFKDKIILGADGRAKVIRRGGPPELCRVDQSLMGQIRDAAGAVDWPVGRDASRPKGKMSDEMFVKVIAGRHHASLDNPKIAKLAGPLGKLLGDITQPAGKRTLCKPH